MKQFGLVLLVLLFFSACEQDKGFYSHSFSETKECWSYEDTLTFSQEVKASSKLQLTGSYDASFPFRNIYIRLQAVTPSGKKLDTLLLDTLSSAYGDWRVEYKNSGFEVPFINTLTLNETGKYSFKLSHEMRNDTLCGIRKISADWSE